MTALRRLRGFYLAMLIDGRMGVIWNLYGMFGSILELRRRGC